MLLSYRKISCQRKALRCDGLRKCPWCDKPSKDGYLEGNGYLVRWCVGHLVELAPPNVCRSWW